VITREAAARTIWGDSPPDGEGALRAHIHTLRSALEAPGESRLLHTLPGIGYRIAIDADG
jgi:DNA-binding winged helix-turn-helix (wHTH) protein